MEFYNNVVSVDFSGYEQDSLCTDESYHQGVIASLEKKLTKQPKCIAALCDWIANYHDLAMIYRQQGNVDEAQKCLLIPHQAMLHMAQNNYGDEEQEQIAMRAISLTLPPLLEFANVNPPCEHCMNELKSQLKMLEKFTETDH